MEIDDLHQETYPDAELFIEKNALNSTRRKRLWMDFEKDEKERIKGIEKDFHHQQDSPTSNRFVASRKTLADDRTLALY